MVICLSRRYLKVLAFNFHWAATYPLPCARRAIQIGFSRRDFRIWPGAFVSHWKKRSFITAWWSLLRQTCPILRHGEGFRIEYSNFVSELVRQIFLILSLR